jgi:hypothetical protein
MTRHNLFAGLLSAVALLLASETAFADHCCCNGGYSIGGYATSPAQIYGGTTYYSSPAVNSYYYQPGYYQPQTVYYRSYPSYGYSGYPRSGLSIQIGSGFGSGYGYSPYRYGNYGFGQRSGFGIGFGFGGSSRGHHHHH